MKERWKTGMLLVAVGVSAGLGGAALAQAGLKLIYNGKVASTNVRLIEGQPYVRVADMSSALGMNLAKVPGGYEISAPGGANQVVGATQGKIGDELFNGRWRFRVVDVKEVPKYTTRFYKKAEAVDAGGDNETLIVVTCQVKNGLKEQQTLYFTDNKENLTALADGDGGSYKPVRVDVKTGEYDYAAVKDTPALLPGAKADFALVFSVPKGTKLKDLVFSLQHGQAPYKGSDVRVSLAE
jgi:hypothetical protein